jgi:Flp pilus assembly protein TadD
MKNGHHRSASLFAYERALECHRAGRLEAAGTLYREVLAVEPRHSEAWHKLGVLSFQSGRQDIALGLIQQAIAAAPSVAVYHSDLGEMYRAVRPQGQRPDSIPAWANGPGL